MYTNIKIHKLFIEYISTCCLHNFNHFSSLNVSNKLLDNIWQIICQWFSSDCVCETVMSFFMKKTFIADSTIDTPFTYENKTPYFSQNPKQVIKRPLNPDHKPYEFCKSPPRVIKLAWNSMNIIKAYIRKVFIPNCEKWTKCILLCKHWV